MQSNLNAVLNLHIYFSEQRFTYEFLTEALKMYWMKFGQGTYDDRINIEGLFYWMTGTRFNKQDRPMEEDLNKLTFLMLDDCELENLNFIDSCPNVRRLSCVGENYIDSLSALSNLKKLVYLNLGGHSNTIVNTSVLKSLENLEEVDLSGNRIECFDIGGPLKNLKRLNLSGNPLKHIRNIQNLKNLEELDLRSNSMEDISIVSKLMNLKKLDLNYGAQSDESLHEVAIDLPQCDIAVHLGLGEGRLIRVPFKKKIICLVVSANRLEGVVGGPIDASAGVQIIAPSISALYFSSVEEKNVFLRDQSYRVAMEYLNYSELQILNEQNEMFGDDCLWVRYNFQHPSALVTDHPKTTV